MDVVLRVLLLQNTGVEITVVLCVGCLLWNKTSIRSYIENDWWDFLRRPFMREGSDRMEGDWYWMEVSALQLVLPTGLSAPSAPRHALKTHTIQLGTTRPRVEKNGLHKYFVRKSGLASRPVLWFMRNYDPKPVGPWRLLPVQVNKVAAYAGYRRFDKSMVAF